MITEYYSQWKLKHPTPNDFKRIAEKVSGFELDWYLTDWTQTTNTIDYGIKWLQEKDGKTSLILEKKGNMPMPLDIKVTYKNGKEDSELYEDADDGYDYTKGRYSLSKFKLTGSTNELIIQQHTTGKYITPYTRFKLKFIGLPFKISKIEVDNVEIDLKTLNLSKTTNELVVDKMFTQIQVM